MGYLFFFAKILIPVNPSAPPLYYGHYMGEEIRDKNNERTIYYKIEADEKIDTVTLVKNERDYII